MFGFLAKMLGGGILQSVFGMVGDHFKDKRKMKMLKASLEQTVVLEQEKRLTTQATADIVWDTAQVKASQGSWKDELFVILFVCMIASAFIAPAWSAAGWIVLANISEFWQFAIGGAIAASFGTKALFKGLKKG
ncbi:MAG: hypothetical protein QQN63_00150 [Nitrosopumilus sp.]